MMLRVPRTSCHTPCESSAIRSADIDLNSPISTAQRRGGVQAQSGLLRSILDFERHQMAARAIAAFSAHREIGTGQLQRPAAPGPHDVRERVRNYRKQASFALDS